MRRIAYLHAMRRLAEDDELDAAERELIAQAFAGPLDGDIAEAIMVMPDGMRREDWILQCTEGLWMLFSAGVEAGAVVRLRRLRRLEDS